ncbi:extracellular matrix protein [Dictyostelium discoideum AX4]|uniref:Extracellular matrix protein n=1 Tax=Dictyostelium discoideum TaxID=44689 RepID=Q54LG5_DICDI|nr:extracellular matrix protein [Dictyostelium discoideum AX4]EAL64079.1 extracellular matrix protein [Dictyostelium discoideum AX4]|eukprot:XP_637596.1 extracellular matrix protein [Dictyostelium discoideum AX4]
MKLLYSLVALLGVSSVAFGDNSCNQLLSSLADPSKCVQVSISGVHSQSLAQEGYKGNLVFASGEFVLRESLYNLQTYETTCSRGGLVQPFAADDQFRVEDFSIRLSDGNLRLKQINTQLTCNGNVGFFNLNNFYYALALKSYDTCPRLYYGEPCNTPTVTPTTTPSPTTKPPTGPLKFNYKLDIDWQWDSNNVHYYQYRVTVTNNDSTAIKSIQIHSDNWNPTEFWNVEKNAQTGNLGFPSFVNTLPVGDSFSFGFVSAVVNPTFSTVSFERV